MKKITFLTTMMLCSFLFNIKAQQYIKIDTIIYSEVLDKIKAIDIFLPPDYYDNPAQEYPVIYYLHGAGGNENSGLQEANCYYQTHSENEVITSPPAIFVCPDGSCPPYLGSMWVNSTLYGNYEDYVMQDVISFIESEYRVIPNKNFRSITGTSMGGFGSAWLGVNHPDKFRICFPFIGFLAMSDTTLENWKNLCYEENGSYILDYNAGPRTKTFITGCGGWSPNLNIEPYQVEIPFDGMGNWVDTTLNKWYGFDASSKVNMLPDENELSWFLGCGTQDFMVTYPTYLEFMDSLDIYGIEYGYNYFIGGHDFNYDTWELGCMWIDSIINLEYLSVGIDKNLVESMKMVVYPNPISANAKLGVEFASSGTINICIYNLGGICHKSWEFKNQQASQCELTLSLNELPAGIYFLHLQAGNEVVTKKVVKL
ncbi:MAG: T9SS type A sorting domain-containing protein [Bacteroidetes bacterium]|nr:T9SS type A sorting domain-containing protein [Bacteroidota bacterium]